MTTLPVALVMAGEASTDSSGAALSTISWTAEIAPQTPFFSAWTIR